MAQKEADVADSMAAWYDHAVALVAQIGKPAFCSMLETALAQVAPFDLSVAFAYPGEARPVLLHNGLKGVSPPRIMENYLSGTYLLDAVYSACRRATPAGLYRLSALAPDDFFSADYYRSPDVHPCISMGSGSLDEEIVFIQPMSGNLSIALSLLRQNGSGAFTDAELARLSSTAAMVGALMSQHWGPLAPEVPTTPSAPVDAMEEAFRSFAIHTLTLREQTIVSLVLRGNSSRAIADQLDIAEGTVKIHRKHIHAKLGISSQTELFAMFVKHLLGH